MHIPEKIAFTILEYRHQEEISTGEWREREREREPRLDLGVYGEKFSFDDDASNA